MPPVFPSPEPQSEPNSTVFLNKELTTHSTKYQHLTFHSPSDTAQTSFFPLPAHSSTRITQPLKAVGKKPDLAHWKIHAQLYPLERQSTQGIKYFILYASYILQAVYPTDRSFTQWQNRLPRRLISSEILCIHDRWLTLAPAVYMCYRNENLPYPYINPIPPLQLL